jgi:hypothetical protein
MRAPCHGRRSLAILSAAFAIAFLVGAAPADLPGWERARWGMTTEDLGKTFGQRLRRLSTGLQYKDSVGTAVINPVGLGRARFTAVFQMDERSRRLVQVLLTFTGGTPPYESYAQTRRALETALGPPSRSERETDKTSNIPWFRVVDRWTFPTTTVVLSYFEPDFEDTARDKSLTVRYFPTRSNEPAQ